MPAAFRCPTCSAPLDLPADNATAVRCPYCGAGALLSERLGTARPAAAPPGESAAMALVVRHVREGNRVLAVKAYRDHFGGGLKEAVDAVDRIAAGQPAGSIPARRGSGGMGWAAILFIAFVAAGGAWIVFVAADDQPAATLASAPVSPAAAPAAPPPPPAFAEEVMRFGSKGTGAGRFEDARSVAVDGTGRIYVAEYGGGRVQVFDSAGAFLTQWMADPKMPLVDMEADRAGTVYIVQHGRIKRFEGATGTARADVPRPERLHVVDIALALDGTIWAAAWGNRLLHLNANGRVLHDIYLRRVVDDEATPERVAVAGTGHLYVIDHWNGSIYHLSPEGRFVDRFGGRGEGPEAMSSPEDVAVDGRGRVYVSDLGQGVRVFDADGRFVAAFAEGVVFGLDITPRDELFAALRNDHQVARFRISP